MAKKRLWLDETDYNQVKRNGFGFCIIHNKPNYLVRKGENVIVAHSFRDEYPAQVKGIGERWLALEVFNK